MEFVRLNAHDDKRSSRRAQAKSKNQQKLSARHKKAEYDELKRNLAVSIFLCYSAWVKWPFGSAENSIQNNNKKKREK